MVTAGHLQRQLVLPKVLQSVSVQPSALPIFCQVARILLDLGRNAGLIALHRTQFTLECSQLSAFCVHISTLALERVSIFAHLSVQTADGLAPRINVGLDICNAPLKLLAGAHFGRMFTLATRNLILLPAEVTLELAEIALQSVLACNTLRVIDTCV